MQKTLKMTETLANRYSYESAQRELSNGYQYDRVQMVFQIFLRSCALDESSLSIERGNMDVFCRFVEYAAESYCSERSLALAVQRFPRRQQTIISHSLAESTLAECRSKSVKNNRFPS